jgi:hypothetical protein
MEQNKIRTYLLYAVGEITLVMIGILLALQVNNWNADRLDRIEERTLLGQLKSELISNKEQLEQKIALRKQSIESILQIFTMIDDVNGKYSGQELDSLIGYVIPVFTFDPKNGVMNQLLGAGKLTLISNDTLRELVSNWSGIMVDFKESENDYSSINRNDYRPFLYKSGNYRSIINNRIKNNVITSTLLDEKFENTQEIGNSVEPIPSISLLNSKEFENYMASLYSFNTYINAQSYGVRNYIQTLIERIEQEIN